MITVLYEDSDVIVVEKPAGVESQSARGFEPDMVSRIRTHIHKLSPTPSPKSTNHPPYVGVIHRLDKPVRGVMVYAKNQKSAANLSAQIQEGKMRKIYAAVVCGKPVDNQGAYVDYLLKNQGNSGSEIVDNSVDGAKRAELTYRVLSTVKAGRWMSENPEMELSLLDIELMTGRYHQIRVQMAGHGTPLFGDNRYGNSLVSGKRAGAGDGGFGEDQGKAPENGAGGNRMDPGTAGSCMKYRAGGPGAVRGPRQPLSLCARKLTFFHPSTGREITCEIKPSGGAFGLFDQNLFG